MTIILPKIIAQRYLEACANPDIARWRSLAYLAGFQADSIVAHEPDSVLADDLRTVSELAWQHCMDMMPAQEPEQYNSLAGVVVGWFRRMAA